MTQSVVTRGELSEKPVVPVLDAPVSVLVFEQEVLRAEASHLAEPFPIPADATDRAAVDEALTERAADADTVLRTGVTGAHNTLLKLTVDEEPRFYQQYSYPLSDTVGSRLEVFEDVTAFVGRTRELYLFEQLADRAQDGLYATDATGAIQYCNESLRDLLAGDRETLIGSNPVSYVHPSEQDRHAEALAALQRGENSIAVELRHVTETGKEVPLELHLTARDGEEGGHIGVARDVSERNKRERRLAQYRTLVESVGDPMYVLDKDGHIELLNEAMVNFLALPRSELVGMDVREVSPQERIEQGRAAIRRIIENDDRTWDTYEAELTDADGTDREFEVTVGIITENGEFAGSVGTFRDISERVRRRAELVRLKQVLERVLRHNLRNELMVVMGQAEMLAERDHAATDIAASVVNRCDALLETADNARLVENALSTHPETVTHQLAGALPNQFEHTDFDDVSVDVADEVAVRGRAEFPTVLRLLVETIAVNQSVTITARHGDDSVTVCIEHSVDSLPVEAVPRSVDDVTFKRRFEVALWLADRIVDRSRGTVSLTERGVVISLRPAR